MDFIQVRGLFFTNQIKNEINNFAASRQVRCVKTLAGRIRRVYGNIWQIEIVRFNVSKESMASLVKVSFIEFLNKALTEMYYANKVGIPKELLCLFFLLSESIP